MASRLHMTGRTLQRKLEQEKLSYRKICNEIGEELASTLLKNKSIKITEVASTLGYSDVRAFQRAFKSWTGSSSKEFRNKLRK